MLVLGLGLALVGALEEVGKDVSYELEGDVLKCPCWAVPELKDVLVVAGGTERSYV